jgi:hypothetical protein
MKIMKHSFSLVAALCLILCFSELWVFAEKSTDEAVFKPIAEIGIRSDGIEWMPKVQYGKLILTVSCPDGTVFSKTFESGGTSYLGISDNGGKPLADGSFTYELVVSPLAHHGLRENPGTSGMNTALFRGGLIQTGYFHVKGGKFVSPVPVETGISRPLDEVVYDDLIVDGSLCVGNDCYSGYTFGWDTIVLMENNLRIYFNDTSNTSSFPTNDWRIAVNDTTDGGGSYFALQDVSGGKTPFTIEAGAKTNTLYIDDDGQVGIGTSAPVFELHIKEGDTPSVRLQQDTSYGWPEQIWDIGGNETSFFIRDGSHAAKLPFRIEPDAPSSTLCLKADGKVGVGTWSPSAQFEIETTGENAAVVFERTDGAMGKFTARPSEVFIGSGSDDPVRIVSNNNKVITVESGGDVGIGLDNPSYKLHISGGAYCDGGAWVPGSSREYKENIAALTLEEAADALEKLSPVKFNYKANPKEDYIGFIAEDVPELVATKERKGVSPMDVVAVLTKVLQDQQKLLKEQQQTISYLNKRITELEHR